MGCVPCVGCWGGGVPLDGQCLLRAEACACARVQEEVSGHCDLEILHGHAEPRDQQAHAPQAQEQPDVQPVEEGRDPPGDHHQHAQTQQQPLGERHLRSRPAVRPGSLPATAARPPQQCAGERRADTPHPPLDPAACALCVKGAGKGQKQRGASDLARRRSNTSSGRGAAPSRSLPAARSLVMSLPPFINFHDVWMSPPPHPDPTPQHARKKSEKNNPSAAAPPPGSSASPEEAYPGFSDGSRSGSSGGGVRRRLLPLNIVAPPRSAAGGGASKSHKGCFWFWFGFVSLFVF